MDKTACGSYDLQAVFAGEEEVESVAVKKRGNLDFRVKKRQIFQK